MDADVDETDLQTPNMLANWLHAQIMKDDLADHFWSRRVSTWVAECVQDEFRRLSKYRTKEEAFGDFYAMLLFSVEPTAYNMKVFSRYAVSFVYTHFLCKPGVTGVDLLKKKKMFMSKVTQRIQSQGLGIYRTQGKPKVAIGA